MAEKYRLVTRSDFDGLVCAILLKELHLINDIKFVHPKDMQDGLIDVGPNDITTNLPYVPGCHMAFDHHLSESLRNKQASKQALNYVIDPNAPSAARVVYDYYGGASRFTRVSHEMMAAVDKADSAQYTMEDILHPDGWVLLNYLMDARTGLGRFREFRISNYQLMMALIDDCRNYSVEEVLRLSNVRERVEVYRAHEEPAKAQIRRCSTVHGNLAVLDLRGEELIYATNRFMIYALLPMVNISVHVLWGVRQKNTVFAIGKSILNRTSKTNVGALCLNYGGGGHLAAGTCQVSNADAVPVLDELIAKITADG